MITQENAKDFMPILQAIADGKSVVIGDGTVTSKQFDFTLSPAYYKIIEPPKPPKKVPLTFEDMEPGMYSRCPIAGNPVRAVLSYFTKHLNLHDYIGINYHQLMSFEIYRPSTGKWEPAYKLQADES